MQCIRCGPLLGLAAARSYLDAADAKGNQDGQISSAELQAVLDTRIDPEGFPGAQEGLSGRPWFEDASMILSTNSDTTSHRSKNEAVLNTRIEFEEGSRPWGGAPSIILLTDSDTISHQNEKEVMLNMRIGESIEDALLLQGENAPLGRARRVFRGAGMRYSNFNIFEYCPENKFK